MNNKQKVSLSAKTEPRQFRSVRMSCTSSSVRAGFTIIELLTVLFIIVVMLAIAIPVVQRMRESARDVQCKGNIQQTCLGLLGYEAAFKCFPSGTTGLADVVDFDQADARSFLSPESPIFWKKAQFASYWIQILPYIEQGSLFETLPSAMSDPNRLYVDSYSNGAPYSWVGDDPAVRAAMSTSFPQLFCPSDTMLNGFGKTELAEIARQPCFDSLAATDGYLGATFERKSTVFGTNYVGCAGVHSGGDVADGRISLFQGTLGSRSRVRIKNIRDGQSNTLLLGEYLGAFENGKRIGGPIWCFGTIARGRGHLPWGSGQANESGYLFGDPVDSSLAGFGSAHSNYINVGLADGSVRNVSKSINLLTWYALCGIEDGKIVHW